MRLIYDSVLINIFLQGKNVDHKLLFFNLHLIIIHLFRQMSDAICILFLISFNFHP